MVPRLLFASRFSYEPAGSHARQLVSSSPLDERIPSVPVTHFTDVSTVCPRHRLSTAHG